MGRLAAGGGGALLRKQTVIRTRITALEGADGSGPTHRAPPSSRSVVATLTARWVLTLCSFLHCTLRGSRRLGGGPTSGLSPAPPLATRSGGPDLRVEVKVP